jgi:hypothetical protein
MRSCGGHDRASWSVQVRTPKLYVAEKRKARGVSPALIAGMLFSALWTASSPISEWKCPPPECRIRRSPNRKSAARRFDSRFQGWPALHVQGLQALTFPMRGAVRR